MTQQSHQSATLLSAGIPSQQLSQIPKSASITGNLSSSISGAAIGSSCSSNASEVIRRPKKTTATTTRNNDLIDWEQEDT